MLDSIGGDSQHRSNAGFICRHSAPLRHRETGNHFHLGATHARFGLVVIATAGRNLL
jgi:hypothetical protein